MEAKCNEITRKIMLWCIEKSSWVVALHLPSTTNVAADEESTMDQRELDWQLDSEVFHKIQFLFGVNDGNGSVCF